jgi:hypothetical protein
MTNVCMFLTGPSIRCFALASFNPGGFVLPEEGD